MDSTFPNSSDPQSQNDVLDSGSDEGVMDECMAEKSTANSSKLPNAVTEVPCDIPGKKSYEIQGVMFTVNERYRLIKVVGVGAYGVVIAAEDSETEEYVALKKISGVFDDLTDARRILREVRLMQTLNHENVRAGFLSFMISSFYFHTLSNQE